MSQDIPYSFEKPNSVSIEEGLKIDGVTVTAIQELKIESDLSNLSRVTVTFLGKIKGLDDLSTKR